ncbi:tumor necrosis factor-like isoform X2 [Mercenaria mercenaria]|uniref:tumor necrosis factor-like isoform X2 n=1 Tax=Mercenaria mercenaria TaxID=6596 RepID=UPI00234F0F26|nr:tumor necrosis factor-like isoform X2 [Mercenaria mercenaria]XP_045202075.2 tumor necrosis factor-like isoform X2 [Mercenaria mercenaria]XP_053403940.1 tumor necrosis factor-like isoform X2 [Mercenaria mercenaria]
MMMSTTKDCSGTYKLKEKCLFMVLIITTCIELLTLLTLVLYWRVMRQSLLTPTRQQLCFKQKFTTAKEMKDCPLGMMMKIENRPGLCCGNADVVFNSFVSKSVSEKFNDNANPETTTLDLSGFNCEAVKPNPVTLHLLGIAPDTKPVPVGTSSKIFWNAPVVSDVKPGFKYLVNDGTIYLERSGFYFVTSQVKMMFGNMNSTVDAVDDIFGHYVNLISKRGVGYTLVGNAKSRCKTIQEESEYTSIVGAVFKLQKGDRIYVAISQPQHLAQDQSKSFFSIYSISLHTCG